MPQRSDGGLNNRQSRSSLGIVYSFSVTGPGESRSDGSDGDRDCCIGPSYRLTYLSDTLYGRALSADSPYGALGDNSKPFASLAKWALALVQGCPSIAVGNSRPLLRRVHLVGIRLFTRSLSRHST